jgi:hypothetical protein
MALNFPGPYGIRIFYTTTPTGFATRSRKMEFYVSTVGTPSPGTSALSIDLTARGGATVNLDAEVDALVALLRPMWPAATDFTHYELWRYIPGSFDAIFITTEPIALSGTGAGSSSPAGQSIITLRTLEGGIAKVSLMESILGPGPQQGFPTGNAAVNALANFLSHPTQTVYLGRDTSYIVAAKGLFPGQNERLFKDRYRST